MVFGAKNILRYGIIYIYIYTLYPSFYFCLLCLLSFNPIHPLNLFLPLYLGSVRLKEELHRSINGNKSKREEISRYILCHFTFVYRAADKYLGCEKVQKYHLFGTQKLIA